LRGRRGIWTQGSVEEKKKKNIQTNKCDSMTASRKRSATKNCKGTIVQTGTGWEKEVGGYEEGN